jgi:hypothetical protein
MPTEHLKRGQEEIDQLAPQELKDFLRVVDDRSNIDSLANICDQYIGFHELDAGQFEEIIQGISQAMEKGLAVLEEIRAAKATRNEPFNEAKLDAAIFFLREKIKAAIQNIEDDVLVTESGNPPKRIRVPIKNLNLHRFYENSLRLGIRIDAIENKYISRENIGDLKPVFRAVAAAEVAELSPEIKNSVKTIEDAYPELTPRLHATFISPEEIEAILKAAEEFKDDPQISTSLLRFIKGDSLENALRQVSSYHGEVGVGEKLNPSVRAQLESLQALIKRLVELSKGDPTFFDDLGISPLGDSGQGGGAHGPSSRPTRAQEILDDINRILRRDAGVETMAGDPTLEGWKTFVLSSRVAGESLESFLNDMRARVTQADETFTDEEIENLKTARRILEEMRANTGMPIYDDPGNTGYNERLQAAKNQFLDQTIPGVSALVAHAEAHRRTPDTGVDRSPRNEDERFKVMRDIYNTLKRDHNPNMPVFEELGPDIAAETMQQLTIGLMNAFQEKFDKTTASGGGPVPVPSESVDLWEGFRFDVPGTIQEKSVDFFFHNFPFDRLIPGLSHEERGDFIEMWKLRIVHIMQMHNYTAEFRKIWEGRKGGDFSQKVVDLVRGRGDDGGLVVADMQPFYRRNFAPGSNLAKLVEKDGNGEDESWRVPQYVDLFIHLIRRYSGDYAPEFIQHYNADTKVTVDRMSNLKPSLLAMIPPEYRIEGDETLVEVAWEIATWTLFPELLIFEFDDEGLTSSAGRSVNLKQYAAKVLIGNEKADARWRDTIAQQIERALIPRTLFMHAYVELPPNAYDVWTLDELVAEIKRLKDLGTEDAKLRADNLNHFRKYVLIKAGGTPELVKQHYRIVKVKSDHCALGLDEGLPIAIPENYFRYSKKKADSPENTIPNRENLIALSEDQIQMSLIDRKYVRLDTLTRSHQSFWAAAAGDMMKWFQFTDLTKPDAIFKPIHDDHLSAKIMKKAKVVDFPTQLGYLNIKGSGFLIDMSDQTDLFLRNQVIISDIHEDEMTRDMGFSVITKEAARYALQNITQCGPYLEGEDSMATGELWAEIFRREWEGESGRHGHGIENFRKLRQTKDTKLIREKSTTAVPKYIRESIDLVAQGKKSKAENQMIVESFIIAVGAYLDQYQYRSVEEGHPLQQSLDLETNFGQIHTVSGAKPMDFAHRQLFLAFCVAQLKAFQHSRDFGGASDKNDPRVHEHYDANPEKSIIHNYDHNYILGLMRDRGLIGTAEQYIVDLYYYENDFKKTKEKQTTAH